MEEVQSLECELKRIEEDQEGDDGAAGTGQLQEDSADGSGGRSDPRSRPKASILTGPEDEEYSMRHGRRGDCLIFVHGHYAPITRIAERPSALHDTNLCVQAFGKLGFEVLTFKNLTNAQFRSTLEKESKRDRSDCDALAVVFMSHGDYKDGREILHTYDGKVDTTELWEPFVGNKCTSLAGKPKLFFIQACRGTQTDTGVGLRVSTDSFMTKKKEAKYVIPAHADMLVMWASYKGMFAFKSSRLGINGSVFIHFLTEVLANEGYHKPLHDLLIQVTRRVALDFESQCPNTALDQNKQVPHISSTLMRRLIFTPRHY